MVTGAQLFVRLDMASLSAICAFPRCTSGLLDGLCGDRGRANVARINH